MGRASARQVEDLGSNPSESQIFHLFRCVLSSLLPLRSVGRSNFDKGLHNLITLIKKRHQIIILLYYIMDSTVDSYEHYIYIYIWYFFIFVCCCCCCRPHSTNVLPAESSTRNHVAASSLSPQVARKGSTLSGFVQRSRLEREVGRDLHSNKWEEV